MRGSETIQLLGISRPSLNRLVKRGVIRVRKLPGHRLDYNEDDVRFYKQNKGRHHLEERRKGCPIRERVHVKDFTPEELARLTGTTLQELARPDRSYDATDRRRVFAALLAQRKYSHNEIAFLLGRSRCVVTHYLKTVYLAQSLLDAAMKKLESRRTTD